jgi:phosphomannomutase
MTFSPTEIRTLAERWIELDNTAAHQELLERWIQEENWSDLTNCLTARLQFGTAGLRGSVGPGSNRMNRGMVQQTALGIAHYVTNQNLHKSVIIGFDARLTSRQFAKDVADVFHSEGFQVQLFDEICTTPLLAFGVTWTQSTIGVMITASHNPAPDNGFKVYWNNGAQIIPPHDSGISTCIERISNQPVWKTHLQDNLEHPVPSEDLRQAYHEQIQSLRLPQATSPCTFVYTAMHGVGYAAIKRAIAPTAHTCIGVPSQIEPDGNFPTTPFPNPEEPGALNEAIQVALSQDLDVILANDPDADRLAVALRVPSHPDRFQRLTGDQIGLILAHYLLENANIDSNTLLANTIVSSSQLKQMATFHSVHYASTLTGFKWLANLSLNHQTRCGGQMLLGYEEALGYSIGGLVNDKDGVSAVLIMADAIGHYQSHGQTLWDVLDNLARRYGLGLSSQQSLRFEGVEGIQKMTSLMDQFRHQPLTSIAGSTVLRVEDYQTSTIRHANGNTETLDFPISNVLVYWLDNQERVIVRPSGTEPKIKFYFEAIQPVDANDATSIIRTKVQQRLDELWNDIQQFI